MNFDKRHKRFHDDGGEEFSQQVHKRRNDRCEEDERPSFREWRLAKGNNFRSKSTKSWQNREHISADQFEIIATPDKPRKYTISIAVPASILEETCIKDELRAYVVGQIARAANIYSIDEIVVYDDKCWRKNDITTSSQTKKFIEMMTLLLEYQECPQYLRKHLFQYHPYLRQVGVLNALNSPHHLRANQWCEYREGVVLDKGNKSLSYVDVGLSSEVSVDQVLEPGLRVTVHLPPEAQAMRKPYGRIVSPDEPREKAGFYWGYTVRVAESLSKVITGSRFPDGYDLLIGTSDKGDDVRTTEYPEFSHALIVFGGVEGLESAIEADNELEATEPRHLFDFYTNTCPLQQARTVRTEEAVLITLCVLQDKLLPTGKQ